MNNLTKYLIIAGIIGLLVRFGPRLLGVVYIPHHCVGILEKMWSLRGSLKDGRIVALNSEAGFQTNLLRGGLHFGLWPWQYRVHRQSLVTIGQGKLGYIYARDGAPLPPTQTLGRIVECNHFQDARAFLLADGQRGRQRLILREGVFAINLALFVVITEDSVYCGPVQDKQQAAYDEWRNQLMLLEGFDPVVIGYGSVRRVLDNQAGIEQADVAMSDNIGIVSVHDGLSIESGEIIAPEVKATDEKPGHNYFQDPESFLALGGKRGKQLQVLTDGTFFINRWFATVEMKPKTMIPIGYVGVVVSYYGETGMEWDPLESTCRHASLSIL